MPILTVPTFTRRQFGFSVVPLAASLLKGASASTRWALLSDTHIPADSANEYRGFRPVENLKKTIPGIQAFNPDAALVCGDIARLMGLSEDYQAFRDIFQPVLEKTPVAFALGNHDDRKNFLTSFGKQNGAQTVPNRHVLVIEGPVVRVVVLDSLIKANETPGFLGKTQRTWLRDYLNSASDTPTLVFLHHTLDDSDGSLHDAPRLMELLRPIRKVKAIFYGHSHVYRFDTEEGLHLINLPAVGYNFSETQPVGWVESVLTREGGEFTLRACGGSKDRDGKTTSVQWRK